MPSGKYQAGGLQSGCIVNLTKLPSRKQNLNRTSNRLHMVESDAGNVQKPKKNRDILNTKDIILTSAPSVSITNKIHSG